METRWYYDKRARSVHRVEVHWESTWHATISDAFHKLTIPRSDLISDELALLLIKEKQAQELTCLRR